MSTSASGRGWRPGGAVETIDVHFHIVPPRFVDLVRSGALREIVDVEREADVDRLTFRPPAGVAIEPDASFRPHLYDAPADPGGAGPARARRGGGQPGPRVLPVLGAARPGRADRPDDQRRHGGAGSGLSRPLPAAGDAADAGPDTGGPRAGARGHGPGAAGRGALHSRQRGGPGRPGVSAGPGDGGAPGCADLLASAERRRRRAGWPRTISGTWLASRRSRRSRRRGWCWAASSRSCRGCG